MTSFQQINCFIIKPITSEQEVIYSGGIIDNAFSKNRKAYNKSTLIISEIENNLSDFDKEYEITGCYDEYFTHEKIEGDYFSWARIDFFMYDLISKIHTKIIKRGFVISTRTEQHRFTFRLQSLKNFLFNRKINKIYSKSCRAEFGDKYCKLNLPSLTQKLGYKPECDKTKKSCREYNNIINYRGE